MLFRRKALFLISKESAFFLLYEEFTIALYAIGLYKLIGCNIKEI